MDERLDIEEQSTDGGLTSPPRDYQMDRIISVVLRGGVLLSAGLLILGALLYFVRVLWGGARIHSHFRTVSAMSFMALGRATHWRSSRWGCWFCC
jgi:hypothetical protein